jgi:ParB family chromosome partitioning protein
MTETSTRTTRRAVKAAGKRKTANRFARLAGGDTEPDHSPSPAADTVDENGLIAGMNAVAADGAHRVIDLPVAEIAAHPFNDSSRSTPQPGEPKWEELLNAVRVSGVRLPVLAVPRDAFLAARPSAEQQISADARYVLVYGHRRRAAALAAGRDTVPAVVDDSIMADDGDLDAMAAENLGREDLSDLAEADLFARYADINLSQRAIAERLGVDQATVSRRLALLLLAPEVRDSVAAGSLPSAEAAALAGKLPYGPHRRWQKGRDRDQNSAPRRAEQVAAQQLILSHHWSASRAAERIIAERDARAEAAALGIALTDDPRTELGEHYTDHRIGRDELSPGIQVVGAVNPNTGHLDLYARPRPDPAPEAAYEEHDAPSPIPPTPPSRPDNGHVGAAGASARGNDAHHDPGAGAVAAEIAAEQRRAAASSQTLRRQACATLIGHQPSNGELLKLLVRQYLSGVAARSQTSAVKALLRDWDATVAGTGEKARCTRAWHHAIAAAELHTASLTEGFDDDAVTHLDLLIERVGYRPTNWESQQISMARG